MGFLTGLSAALLRFERWLLIGLAAIITLLILLNVVTRAFAIAIYWVDELAIYAMIWMVMIGASTMIRNRSGIAVTLLQDVVSPAAWRAMELAVDIIILGFALLLLWFCWIWYDPLTLAGVGFDFEAFTGKTFNYIYQEPTLTVGVQKYVVWLVMPITAFTMSVHALTNVLERVSDRSGPQNEAAS